MQSNPFFSVICPTFNSENFIKKNITSLLNQSYKNFEVIYSDDGSIDKTVDIIKGYKKNFLNEKINFRIVINSHQGPGAARNHAIKLSNFDWISFIDSDDEWSRDKLKKVSQTIKNYGESNCIVHNEIFKKKNGEEIKFNYKKDYKKNLLVFNQLFFKNFLSTSAISLKKNLIIEANYFDETLASAQDYDLWLRIGNNFKFVFIDEYLGYYNERADNITSRPYKFKIKNLLRILKKNRDKIGFFTYYYKLLRILINREWFK